MLTNRIHIGVDTSCYTTSLAVWAEGELLQFKKMLEVKQGECGLRQSDALFQHIKNLPELFDQLAAVRSVKKYPRVTIAVSARPRRQTDSYMPVFLAGKNFGRTVADVLEGEFFEFSHQEGHIMAAVHSCGMEPLTSDPFLVFHLSGGTTELLLARRRPDGFETEIVGGTRDLPAGQFVDRIGTLLGMPFPAGAFLDQLAACQKASPVKAAKVEDGYFHFSGPETQYRRLYEQGAEKGLIAHSVMECIGRTVLTAVRQMKRKHHADTVIMVGGVSSSAVLRNMFEEEPGIHFADPAFSTDNAAGICLLGKGMSEYD